MGIERPQIVEDALVHDFSGEADVFWRDPMRHRAHESASPMSWGSRDMGCACGARTRQEISNRLFGTRKHERSAVNHRTQEDLEATIAADIIEGAPDYGA